MPFVCKGIREKGAFEVGVLGRGKNKGKKVSYDRTKEKRIDMRKQSLGSDMKK